ncbi:Uma2 family endonuclease, partial [Synechococcus sp. H55.11]
WEGRFRDIETTWIRWATSSGELVPTEAELERQRAEQERQRAEQAEQRADRLAQKLRELGVDPDAL